MTEPALVPFTPGPQGRLPAEFARRHREEPLGPVRLPSGDSAIMAVRYEDVVTILSDPRFTRELNYPGAPRMVSGMDVSSDPEQMLNMDPPRHTRLRRLLSGTFTPRQITAWRPRVRTIANELIDGMLAQQGPVDVVEALAFPLPIQVICDIMGVEGIDTERVRGWSDDLLSTAALTPDQRIESAFAFAVYMAELITAHRAAPGDGLIAALIQARDEDGNDRLNDDELTRIAMTLVAAGHETTASVLSRGLLRLLEPRERYEALVESPAMVEHAVEELLRMEVPGDAGLPRVAKEDVELSCGVVRKGQAVLSPPLAANHDPEVFPDPQEYRPGREGTGHIAFGRGAHYCLGANLARMELQEALSALVERLPDLALVTPAADVPWTTGHLVRRPERLLVRTRA
ncbi:cytochrome P450 [Actinomadura rudentiformis]|uniref:Cytochrome P450 n=1 Tax=Actinomadura rudentiformis TaxID=359158 RepID=A0A6H9YTL3_9ACTN|nr:cytochrome P450 [Actinomadura rudentiformis]KAB2343038.1 cytochrome P450 [Actinomadura rudentiformis]